MLKFSILKAAVHSSNRVPCGCFPLFLHIPSLPTGNLFCVFFVASCRVWSPTPNGNIQDSSVCVTKCMIRIFSEVNSSGEKERIPLRETINCFKYPPNLQDLSSALLSLCLQHSIVMGLCCPLQIHAVAQNAGRVNHSKWRSLFMYTVNYSWPVLGSSIVVIYYYY